MYCEEKIITSLGKDLLSQWQSMTEKPDELSKQINRLAIILVKIKEINETKKISAAKIGKLKKQGENVSKMVEEQSSLKKELKSLKSSKAQLEESICKLFKKFEIENQIPPRFFPKISANKVNSTCDIINILPANRLSNQDIDQYIHEHTYATPYHFSCWRDLICQLFGHKDLSLVAVNQNSQIQGFIPIIKMQSYLFGNFCISLPYFNYGGPLTDNTSIESRLIKSAIDTAKSYNVEHLEIRDLKPRQGFKTKQEKVSMILKLPETTEELSIKLGTKLRAQIKRSRQYMPDVKLGKLELVNDFYKVFSINMRDLGTPVYSKNFFYKVIETWYEQADIIVIYINHKPVSAALLLGYKETLEIPWASALKKTNKIGINMFMYWHILCHAIDHGYDFFDFGRSSKDSGTYKFKKQWGAIPQQNYWNYWIPDGQQMPQINPNNAKYKLLISVWKKLPVFIANTIGPPIVKNIP